MSTLPFDQRDGFIWYNGEMLPWQDVKVHVLTHALHYGSSVFEGTRVYNDKPFLLTEHNQRLHDSAGMLDFEIPWTVEQLDAACLEVMKANNIKDGYLRPVAWRGSEQMGISAQETKIHTAIAAWEWPSYYDAEMREKGIRLETAKWKRPSPETIPARTKAAGLYMICTVSKHAAEANGCQDALMHDWRGYVAEATSANIFFVFDGALHTPVPDAILNGFTRQTVIELAKKRGIEVVERVIMPDEIKNAQEVFLTGTAAEVTAVGRIDDLNFTVGPVTRQLREDYESLVKG